MKCETRLQCFDNTSWALLYISQRCFIVSFFDFIVAYANEKCDAGFFCSNTPLQRNSIIFCLSGMDQTEGLDENGFVDFCWKIVPLYKIIIKNWFKNWNQNSCFWIYVSRFCSVRGLIWLKKIHGRIILNVLHSQEAIAAEERILPRFVQF